MNYKIPGELAQAIHNFLFAMSDPAKVAAHLSAMLATGVVGHTPLAQGLQSLQPVEEPAADPAEVPQTPAPRPKGGSA